MEAMINYKKHVVDFLYGIKAFCLCSFRKPDENPKSQEVFAFKLMTRNFRGHCKTQKGGYNIMDKIFKCF